MSARLGRRTPPDGLIPSSPWTIAVLGAVGREHMVRFGTSSQRGPTSGAGGLLETPRANRRDTLGALVLLVGTLRILFGLALVVGTPITGVQ